ncbi:MAG: 30S ribosomal protein S4 [Chloroflexi bacterium]|nr:30S ribosomal protein S4 [Chloroflexota bacterium]
MSKYVGPVCRLCRREGEKLYLKGSRCLSPKCPFDKAEPKDYAPGAHGKDAQFKRRGRGVKGGSDFARQLREKQKARRIYGVLEKQFERYYNQALRRRGLTGLNLLQILETRLDNVIFRLGYASSRAQARLLVTHGHFNVNGRRTDVPSYVLKPGDEVTVREGSRGREYFRQLVAAGEDRPAPSWLSRDFGTLSGQLVGLPPRHEIDAKLNEQLIVEFYSR